ncbi:hypothetical protein [uncultured Succinivibrio sp.]|uniref:hypothetical protein n=1 Tax=uncultured Succinivibrio sp. TaxID=540749 RepID=UPI0025F7D9BD|nr:hypothetical protein [uncultured Succinivibrio sp.]
MSKLKNIINGILFSWFVWLIVSVAVVVFSNLYVESRSLSNAFISVACSTISASAIAFYVDFKSKRKLDKAKEACCEELVADIHSLCSILYWLYVELNNNKSPILGQQIDFNDNIEFRKILVKCQKLHSDEDVDFDELCSVISKYIKLDLSIEQKLFLKRFSEKNISYLVKKILIDIQELKKVFLWLDPTVFLNFKDAVKKSEGLLNDVAILLQPPQNNKVTFHNILSILGNPIKQVGKFLNLDKDKIHVRAILTLPEKITDVIF